MGGKTLLVVPATVPDANVRRMPRVEPDAPHVVCADPYPVPVARATRVVPELLTVEQVEQLRRENVALREELARVRSR
jgi:hypothetical protein